MTTQNAGYYVVGAKELTAALRAAYGAPDMLKDANQRVSEFVAGAARVMAPIGDSADLQGTVRGSRQAGRAVVRAGSAAVPYAGNNHYGWPGRPNPSRGWRGGSFPGSFFIINAAQSTEQFWLQDYINDVNTILDKIGASTP